MNIKDKPTYKTAKSEFGEHWHMSHITALRGCPLNSPVSTGQCTAYMPKNDRLSFSKKMQSYLGIYDLMRSGKRAESRKIVSRVHYNVGRIRLCFVNILIHNTI
jgi:hypothetical protein